MGIKASALLLPIVLLAGWVSLDTALRQSRVRSVTDFSLQVQKPASPNPVPAPERRAPMAESTRGFLRANAQIQSEPEAVPAWPATAAELEALLYPQLGRIRSLEHRSPSEAVVSIAALLDHADPVIRVAAVDSLADLDHPRRSTLLSTALFDPDSAVRIAAIDGLAMTTDQAGAAGIEALLLDPEFDVRIAAIGALADLAAPQSSDGLGALLGDPDARIRRHAAAALGEIGTPPALAYLRVAAADPDAMVRASAADSLREARESAYRSVLPAETESR